MPDLLPADFGTETLQPPLLVLREQAELLGRRTGGLVLASVRSQKSPWNQGNLYGPPGPTSSVNLDFLHRFVLEVPTLDDYNYTLFTVTHPLLLYPLNLHTEVPRGPEFTPIGTPADFEEALRTVFAHAEVRKIISALMAQAAVGTSN